MQVLLTAYGSFSITLASAAYGCRFVYRKGRRDVSRRYRQLTSPQAIAFYRFLGVCLLILCCAVFWMGWQLRAILQPVVDQIVENNLAPIAIPQAAEPEPTATEPLVEPLVEAIAPVESAPTPILSEVTDSPQLLLPPAKIEPTAEEPVTKPKRKRSKKAA